MFYSDTDREWERFGKNDPYFGVLTDDKFRTDKLTEENKEEFFRSGYERINFVLKTIKRHIDPKYKIKRALDFGCGVGRLVIPLAEAAEYVVGVDVSNSMLDEAKKNCEARSIKNLDFVKSDDKLSLLDGKFNFIHSFIVFQHIPRRRGLLIFENLMAHLDEGGVCVVHFTYDSVHRKVKLVSWIKKYFPLSKNFINLASGREFFAPQMQMNNYDISKVFLIMQRSNVSEYYAEYSNHGGVLGIVLYFRKPENE